MSDIEVMLTDLGEYTTRDIAKKEHPQGLKENLNIVKRGGKVSKIAKEYYELETGNKVINNNQDNIKYIDNK